MTDPATLIGLLADENRLRVFGAMIWRANRRRDRGTNGSRRDGRAGCAAASRRLGAGRCRRTDSHVSLEALREAARRRPERERQQADATDDEQRVLRNFVVDGRLVRLPARQAQKQVVLGYVARRFDESRSYEEREVNDLLRDFHDDTASLRRYLVDEGLLEREAGVYRRA